ncbi:MAG: PDDEXK nuclease domain-containing protein [Spirochaetaceae bacterium]|nr:PDDEXK nuclease domain-containing protein [Spirochaetaceae bacterium]
MEKGRKTSKKDTQILQQPVVKSQQNTDELDFYKQVAELLTEARKYAKRELDNTIAITYFQVGRMIVEREQKGQKRAQYGTKLIKGLSGYLTERYGKGYSISSLKNIRQFYLVYMPVIDPTLPAAFKKSQALSGFLDNHTKNGKSQTLFSQFNTFNLGWSYYLILMRIDNVQERQFYEIETRKQQWTVRQLQRQVGSSLYERLALSRDKDKVMALANEGQALENPRDLFKTPYIFEFTGLEERSEYSETELEQTLINNIQKFLLELGKGFLFEARQKRFTFDEDSFYVDLVFYNRLLQCYIIIDLKVGKLKHQDLGQMLMYVNYFDRYVKQEFEKPTIGILMCSQKNDNIVELTLQEDTNIYASAYSLYLPDKALLQRKLAEWVAEFEEEHGGRNQ